MKRKIGSLLGVLILLISIVTMTGCPQGQGNQYKVTLDVGENGQVDVSPVLPKDGMVAKYTTLTFTAKPNEGYEPAGWTGAAPDSTNLHKATLTVSANTTVTVKFKKQLKKYKITLTQSEHGTVKVEPPLADDGKVEQYTTLTFTATPNDGYALAEWIGAVPDSTDKNKATLTVTADAEVSAVFKTPSEIEKDGKSLKTYEIKLNAENKHGKVTVDPPLPADGKVEQYKTLTFTAKPDAGYEVEWTGAAPDSTDKNKAVLTVTAKATVTAKFKLQSQNCKVALSSGNHGTVEASGSSSDGIISVAKDTEITFTAKPDFGYEVDSWTGATEDSTDKNKATLKVTADTAVKVTFKPKQADTSLLKITSSGVLVGVTDTNALIGSLVLPPTVKSIYSYALSGCKRLTDITIPQGVTEIGHKAFAGCIRLTKIAVPDSIQSIENKAFLDCADLESVIIGKGLNSFSSDIFANCPRLRNITVDDKNENLCSENNIIYNKDKTTLMFAAPSSVGAAFTIPESVTHIDSNAFSGCTKLNTVTVSEANTQFCSEANVVYTKDKKTIIFVPKGLTGEVKIPDETTNIDDAFNNCAELTGLTIGKDLNYIRSDNFSGCSKLKTVTVSKENTQFCSVDNVVYTKDKKTIIFVPKGLTGKVTIPDETTQISNQAFQDCQELTDLTIGKEVTDIYQQAFENCIGLKSITINAVNLNSIAWSAFEKCTEFTSLTIGADVKEFTWQNFNNFAKLKTVLVSDANTKFCSVDNVVYKKDKTEIIFVPKGLTGKVTIPDETTQISYQAFQNCQELTDLTIGKGVTGIYQQAFENCIGLKSITINAVNLNSIAWGAFEKCTEFTSLTIGADVKEFTWQNFNNFAKLKTVLVSDANTKFCSVDNVVYKKDKKTIIFVPKGLTGKVTIPDELTQISNQAFQNCKELTGITIGAGLNDIRSDDFYNCSKLKTVVVSDANTKFCSVDNVVYKKDKTEIIFVPKGLTGEVTIPDETTQIGNYEFHNYQGLTGITIGKGVTNIGYRAFYKCIGLTSITINADNLSSLNWDAFDDCNEVISLTIGKDTAISNWGAFSGLAKLSSVTIDPANTAYCREGSFVYTKDKTGIIFALKGLTGGFTIPDTIKKIDSGAFANYKELTGITIGKEVTSIGYRAFKNCIGLKRVTINAVNLSSLNGDAFSGCTEVTSLTIGKDTAISNWGAFSDFTKLNTVTVDDSNSAFCSVDNVVYTSDMTEIIFAPKGLTGEITIPDATMQIGNYEFQNCQGLIGITIGKNVTNIGYGAFKNCIGLTSITINADNLSSIAYDAFKGIKDDAQFTVKTQEIKTLLTTNCGILETQITVMTNP